MTVNRNKKQDIKHTDEQILNKENVVRNDKSWLDHTQGGANLDYDLLQGATIEEMMTSSGRLESSVLNHISHLVTEHGLVVSEKDGVYKLEPSSLKGTINKKNKGLFKAVQMEHILKAVEDFNLKGASKGLGSSKYYDVKINDVLYPPKPIMAYANYHASGRPPGNYFSGGVNTPCFRAYERMGVEIVKKNHTSMNNELYKIKDDFLKEWPIERLQTMNLEEYTNLDKTSFCYWIEQITRELGSVAGGSSYKFGIYKRSGNSDVKEESNRTTDGDYAWFKKYGETREEAYETVKNIIIKIAVNAQNNNLEEIENIDLGFAYKWKIAFLYSDFQVMNIFKLEWIKKIAEKLKIEFNKDSLFSEIQSVILGRKDVNQDYFDYTKGLWEIATKEKINIKADFEKWLKSKTSINSNKVTSYLRAIDLLKDQFQVEVYDEESIDSLKELYEDLKLHQKTINGKYFYDKAKSYGTNGFYSAAVKSFIEFLESSEEGTSIEINVINEPESSYSKIMNSPLNQILYGPPGTGKTYKLKNEYFKKYVTQETSISTEKNLENVVKELKWVEVIALALLELGRSKVSDILENRWVVEKAKISESENIRAGVWGQLQYHTILDCELVKYKKRNAPYIFNKTKDSFWEVLDSEIQEQLPQLYDIKERVDNFIPNPDKEIKRYVFTTFHQSFAYEDFIEGIKPKMDDDSEETEDLTYIIQPGVFKKLCTDAKNDPENKYAIFIDEINRGNVSNIFGELITLIEPDKRKGAENELSAILPYSKKKFSVPNNVDIYGTMNTADRSVEALDTALRRRFSFQEIMPNPDKINTVIDGISLRDVLMKINERIEVLIDRDHTIGHSYFMFVDSEEGLKLVFKDKIIPLLQEYFYGDYGKIGLVLGDGFVELQKKKDKLFANFKYERKDELNNDFYKLKLIDDDFSIISAVNDLLHAEDSEV